MPVLEESLSVTPAVSPMALASLVRTWLLRLPFIVALGVLAGLAAWFVGRDEPTRYEQVVSFALAPDRRLSVEETSRAVAALDNRESAITQTIVGLLRAGPSLPVPESEAVERTVTLRPGTTLIDVEFSGEDASAIGRSAQAYRAAAPQLVSRSYRIFRLEPLRGDVTPDEVPSSLTQTIGLAVLLGLALGMGVAALELRGRGRRDRPERRHRDDTDDEADAERLAVVPHEPGASSRADPLEQRPGR